ncbi:MAG: hypothetical protein ACXQTR_01815 [Candidatus Methanospirareceae archaeon]
MNECVCPICGREVTRHTGVVAGYTGEDSNNFPVTEMYEAEWYTCDTHGEVVPVPDNVYWEIKERNDVYDENGKKRYL